MGLLTTHPETKDIFNKFRHVHLSELKGSEVLRDHGLKVISILDKAIFRVKDHEAQIRILLNEGALHMDNQIEERYLKTMGEYFIKAVKKRNKKHWNKNYQQAWDKFFAMVTEYMMKGGEIKRLSYMLKENELEKANVI